MAGTMIKHAELVEKLAGDEMIPISDGSDKPKAVTPDQLKAFSKQDLNQLATKKELKSVSDKVGELQSVVDRYESPDYCVGWWKDGDLAPEAKEVQGDKSILRDWDFYLLDTTDNAGKKTTPVGKLKKNNLLRFADGRFAPTVGITEAMRAECDVELYMDNAQATKYCEAGAFDAEEFYNIYDMDTPLYNAAGEEVRILRPWETTETKYTIGMALPYKVYLLDNVKGRSGKVWRGIFKSPMVWDGIDVSEYPLEPTAIAPCPVCTIGGKTRNFFFLYEGEANCKSSAGQNGLCTMFLNGRTYPRVNDMQQVNNMNYARANNADGTLPYPFAEGGFHALNTYITSQELLYETKYLHDAAKFSSGISSNNGPGNESQWLDYGGIRYKLSSSGAWKYANWNTTGDIYYNAEQGRNNFSVLLNQECPKEQCMESQMAASFAAETGVAEGAEFEFYGSTYWYKNVTGAMGLTDGDMNVRVYKKMAQTFDAFDNTGASATWDVEVVLRMGLYGGMNLSGDIFAYWGGGYEMVGTLTNDVNVSRVGNPVKLYLRPEQERWKLESSYTKTNLGTFDFEQEYVLVGEVENSGDSYAIARSPYSGYKTEKGGNISTGECFYMNDTCYWASTLGQRTRIAARFRLHAANGICAPRSLSAFNGASSATRYNGGSAQALISAAPPQAE